MTKKEVTEGPRNRTFTKAKPRTPVDCPAVLELADAAAIQAQNRGEATPEQQKRVLAWIIAAARTYETSYYPNDRDTSFAEGRRFVGNQIVGAINAKLSAFKKQ